MSVTNQKESITCQKRKIPCYQDVNGYRISGMLSPEAFRSALTYKPRPDDLFIVTYPKSGTTWVQNIVACIYRDGKPFETGLEFLTQSPFLEMTGAVGAEIMKRPGGIKSHFPFHMMPWSSRAKYIFIARNPKDCCVSYFHHTVSIPGYRFEDGKFEDYFELFLNGQVDFGDYFDTVLSWYEHRKDPNVLFLTYEQLKKDTKTWVLKIAEFLGPQYKEKLEKDEQLLNDVIHHSSFDFLKEHFYKILGEMGRVPKELIVNNPDIPREIRKLLLDDFAFQRKSAPNSPFVRKGIVGDWKNYFSSSQSARLMEKFRERTAGTDLSSLWEDYM